MRFTGDFVTEVLIEAGDTTAARQSASRNLAWARETGDLLRQSGNLVLLVDLDLRAGDLSGAARHLREAVQIAVGMGAHHRVIVSFDLYGHLCAQRAQWAEAVTIWAAFKGHLEASDIKDSPLSAQRRQGPLDQAAQALGPARTQAAEERGVALTLDTAAEFVLMLADAPASAPSAPGGMTNLSVREQELMTLVAKGRTDAQIASQLFISISTVRSHLDRIRDKTSCRRRAELTRLALQAAWSNPASSPSAR